MSKLDEARKIYEKVNGDEAKFIEATNGMLTLLGAKTYFNTIKREASVSKRFDVIELDTNITEAFKARVLQAFNSYYVLSDLKWETRAINHKEMFVLTSSSVARPDAAAASSLSAMKDGLRWGYAEGLAAPKKALTKQEKAAKLYYDCRGDRDRFMRRAPEELSISNGTAETHFRRIKERLQSISPVV